MYRLSSLLRFAGLTFCVAAQLSACSTPNSSANVGFGIGSVNGEPATQLQAERDLGAIRRALLADGFGHIDLDSGPLLPPEQERNEFRFSHTDFAGFHGWVTRRDDDTIRVFIVDNRRGEREGFDVSACKAIMALRGSLHQQFGDRLLKPAPDEQARQRIQLRACE